MVLSYRILISSVLYTLKKFNDILHTLGCHHFVHLLKASFLFYNNPMVPSQHYIFIHSIACHIFEDLTTLFFMYAWIYPLLNETFCFRSFCLESLLQNLTLFYAFLLTVIEISEPSFPLWVFKNWYLQHSICEII